MSQVGGEKEIRKAMWDPGLDSETKKDTGGKTGEIRIKSRV